jgi:hypothetical protein
LNEFVSRKHFTFSFSCLNHLMRVMQACFRRSRGNEALTSPFRVVRVFRGLKPKNEKTKPNYFRPFLMIDASSIAINRTPSLKMPSQKRSQIWPGKGEVRMKNEEKIQFLSIISVHSRNSRKTLRLFVDPSSHPWFQLCYLCFLPFKIVMRIDAN